MGLHKLGPMAVAQLATCNGNLNFASPRAATGKRALAVIVGALPPAAACASGSESGRQCQHASTRHHG